MGFGPHSRMSDSVKAAILEEVVQACYEKAGKEARYLYVEVDEDHAALQFHEKKGDIKCCKGYTNNTQIVKLV